MVHHFKRPKPSVRERLAERIGTGKMKGGRVLKETYQFWKQHIINVEGYDELTGKNGDTKDIGTDYWNGYFNDAIGQEHIQSSVVTLLGKLGGEETDYIKKSDSSQEE